MVENKKRKKKGEAGARLKEQQAVQEKVIADKPKTFTVDGKQVSESEFEKSKRTTGTSQKSTKESELLAQKAEATRVGLKEAGATLTPQIVAGLQAREQAQVAQAPVLREETINPRRLRVPTKKCPLNQRGNGDCKFFFMFAYSGIISSFAFVYITVMAKVSQAL